MRQSQRLTVDQPARLQPNTWSSVEVRLVDVSETGFRAECDAKVIVGLPVKLEIEGIGTIEALVSWRREGAFGARFNAPVDLSRAGLTSIPKEKVLARLLMQRATARQTGRLREEQEIRRQILSNLPMRRLSEA